MEFSTELSLFHASLENKRVIEGHHRIINLFKLLNNNEESLISNKEVQEEILRSCVLKYFLACTKFLSGWLMSDDSFLSANAITLSQRAYATKRLMVDSSSLYQKVKCLKKVCFLVETTLVTLDTLATTPLEFIETKKHCFKYMVSQAADLCNVANNSTSMNQLTEVLKNIKFFLWISTALLDFVQLPYSINTDTKTDFINHLKPTQLRVWKYILKIDKEFERADTVSLTERATLAEILSLFVSKLVVNKEWHQDNGSIYYFNSEKKLLDVLLEKLKSGERIESYMAEELFHVFLQVLFRTLQFGLIQITDSLINVFVQNLNEELLYMILSDIKVTSTTPDMSLEQVLGKELESNITLTPSFFQSLNTFQDCISYIIDLSELLETRYRAAYPEREQQLNVHIESLTMCTNNYKNKLTAAIREIFDNVLYHPKSELANSSKNLIRSLDYSHYNSSKMASQLIQYLSKDFIKSNAVCYFKETMSADLYGMLISFFFVEFLSQLNQKLSLPGVQLDEFGILVLDEEIHFIEELMHAEVLSLNDDLEDILNKLRTNKNILERQSVGQSLS